MMSWWNTRSINGHGGGKHTAGHIGKHGGLARKRRQRKLIKLGRKQARRTA